MRNESLLQLKATPDEYFQALEDFNLDRENARYWDILPMYPIATCPYCGVPYKEKLDTYSLRHWNFNLMFSGAYTYLRRAPKEHCKHWIAVHPFLALNGNRPEISNHELIGVTDIPSEQPLVMDIALPGSNKKSQAVMHSLPICKYIDGKFVPTYTLYTITYFEKFWFRSTGRHRLIKAARKRSETMLTLLVWPWHKDEFQDWWDLEMWVRKGKLLWMEPDNPTGKLVEGPVEDFPYRNLKGRKLPYWDTMPYTDAEIVESQREYHRKIREKIDAEDEAAGV